jgi:hypothetical protein
VSVYVGIDVHRKRSQLAVVDANGEVLANRNVPNGAEPILKVIGGLPPGTPAAFEAAFGTGWLAGAARELRLRPAPGAPVAVQGDRLRAAEERQGRRRDPGAAAARGPAPGGLDRAARGAPAARAAAAPGAAGPAADPAAQPDPAPSWPTTATAARPGAGAGRAGNGSPRSNFPPRPARWSMTTWR